MSESAIGVARVLGALALCLMLGIAAILFMRRVGMGRVAVSHSAEDRIHVLDKIRLDPKVTLHLVQSGDARILIACDPAGVRTLHRTTSKQELGS